MNESKTISVIFSIEESLLSSNTAIGTRAKTSLFIVTPPEAFSPHTLELPYLLAFESQDQYESHWLSQQYDFPCCNLYKATSTARNI
jgi:membrane glycosyltransferase